MNSGIVERYEGLEKRYTNAIHINAMHYSPRLVQQACLSGVFSFVTEPGHV